MALAAGLAELGGGLLLATGLLTPLAVLAIAVVMVNAIATLRADRARPARAASSGESELRPAARRLRADDGGVVRSRTR